VQLVQLELEGLLCYLSLVYPCRSSVYLLYDIRFFFYFTTLKLFFIHQPHARRTIEGWPSRQKPTANQLRRDGAFSHSGRTSEEDRAQREWEEVVKRSKTGT
jgi:hypothetical protein